MAKTAVEWLFENIWLNSPENLPKIVEQAKEMEKQQIIDAFLKHRDSKFIHSQKINWGKSAEQYYNETFKNL